MTGIELAVIIGGSLLGFWVVSSLISDKPPRSGSTETANKHDAAPREDAQGSSHGHHQDAPSQAGARPIAETWFLILEVAETAGKDEIASAYKQKIRQYHPDKVASLGPEIRHIAETKSKEINAAYDYAMQLRG
jgi:DnaJ like chaperone protein